jgi:multidrug efflux system membrane fusion protein
MTPQPSPDPPRNSRSWIWLLLLIGVAGGAVYLYPRMKPPAEEKAEKGKAGKGRGGAPPRVVPVVAAAARKGDMPVYLNGLGSVSPLNTVNIRTRVDGELLNVAYTEGQMVKQGDLLAEVDPRTLNAQLAQFEAQKARDESILANARLDMTRYKALLGQDAIPKQQFDTQNATVLQLESTVKADEAQIENIKLQLFYSRITSPLTGRIGLRLVDRGNIVRSIDAGPLAVVTQLQPIAVLFNIAEDSLPIVNRKMQTGEKLTVFAWDRDLKTRLGVGTLLTIDNQIDPASGTVRFKASFANDDLSLFPNQFVNARLLVDTVRNAVIVPNAAIQRSPTSTFVYVIAQEKAVPREIVPGAVEADETVIDKGLAPGEIVAIDGIDRLDAGARVVVRMAGAPPGRGESRGGAAPAGRSGRGAPETSGRGSGRGATPPPAIRSVTP